MLKTFDGNDSCLGRPARSTAMEGNFDSSESSSRPGAGFRILRSATNRIAKKHPAPNIVVAIPVCNELERISRCIKGLEDQRDLSGLLLARGMVTVLLLTNGCTDGTYEFVVNAMDRWRVAVSVIDVSLPPHQQNAGCARRVANALALKAVADRNGLLFMTDADSVAPPQWIATYSALLRDGYDAVAGLVDLHPDDCAELTAALCNRGSLEDRFTSLLDQLDALVDPIAHDPWPKHANASGANTGVRVDVLRGIDDFPTIACGEDRLFVKMLEARGRRIRHDRETRVRTSGRLTGRAAGGMADTLRHRLAEPDSLCDIRLEPACSAYRRAKLRKQLRVGFDRSLTPAAAANFLGVKIADVETPLPVSQRSSSFEELWQYLEASSPCLTRHPIAPSQLPYEIEIAEELIKQHVMGVRPVDEPMPRGDGRE